MHLFIMIRLCNALVDDVKSGFIVAVKDFFFFLNCFKVGGMSLLS